MDDLLAFFAARLDEDERGATGCMNCGLPIRKATTDTGWTHSDRSAIRGGWLGIRCPGKVTGALPWPDPARALAEVAAKRAILVGFTHLHDDPERLKDPLKHALHHMLLTGVVLPLVAIYRDHEGYDPEWKP